MKNRQNRTAKVGILLLLVLVAAGWSCQKQTALQQAATASEALARECSVFEKAVEQAYDSKIVDKQEALALILADEQVILANREFRKQIAAIEANPLKSKGDLAIAASELTKSLANLNETGVLHIKDPQLRTTLTVVLKVAQTALESASAFLQ